MRGLQGKVVVITGAGRGVGQAIAERLAAEGARVAVTDVDEKSALSSAAGLEGAAGFRLDITDAAEVSARVEEIASALGPIDALVNTPGGTGWRRSSRRTRTSGTGSSTSISGARSA